MGRCPDSPIVPQERLGETRAEELREAGRRIGLASVTVLGWPDGALAAAPADAVVGDIARWLTEKRPDVVITWGPDGGYGHPDHIAAGARTLQAIARVKPVHEVRRCYRFVVSVEVLDAIAEVNPGFADYMKTLAVKPERWTRDRLKAVVDATPYLDRKWHAMQAHRTQSPDLQMWDSARQRVAAIFRGEVFIREFPDPGGPVEHDLFAALRAGS